MVGRDCRERERAASAASEKRRSIGWRARRERRGGEGAREHRDFLGAFRCSSRSIPRVVAIEQSRAGELSSRGLEGGAPVSSPLAFSLSISLSLSPLLSSVHHRFENSSKVLLRKRNARPTRDRVHASAFVHFSFPLPTAKGKHR